MAVGKLIDRLYKQDSLIDKIEAELRAAKKVRDALEEKLLAQFEQEELDGAIGGTTGARARVQVSNYPKIKDRAKFWQYVVKNKAFDLLQNRIASKAYFDRVEEGENIGGVEIFRRTRVSVTKVR